MKHIQQDRTESIRVSIDNYPYVCRPDSILRGGQRALSILVTAPYAVDKEQYSPVSFARWLEKTWQDGCPLCLQPHAVQIHTYVDRSYRNPEKQENGKHYAVVFIVVPRLYCSVNQRLRKHHGKLLQYTLTVLPAFLAPHSVILVDKLHTAVEAYIKENPDRCSYQEAALQIGCDEPVSFVLYLRRIKLRLPAWIVVLSVLALTLGAQIKQADVRRAPQTDLEGQWM